MLKKLISIILSAVMCTALLSACGAAGDADGRSSDRSGGKDALNVVTTIFAPYDFVRQIAGDCEINLTMLIPPGTETHSYDPTTQDIIKVSSCDLFIYTGGENDKWVEEILSSINNEVNTIKLVDCVTLYEEELVEGMTEEQHSDSKDSDSAEWDEHVWTSPKNAVSIVNAISEEMQALDQNNAASYMANATAYTGELTELDNEFRTTVDSAKRKTVIFADRFPARYFTEEFGLDYYAAFPGCAADSEPSAATVAYLINKVKSENIPVVFYIELSNEKMADTICEATGASKLLFHSCHNVSKEDFNAGVTYLSLMRGNLENLKTALN